MARTKFSLMALIALCFSTIFAQEYKIEDFLPDSLTTWQIYGRGNISGNYTDQQYSKNSKPVYRNSYNINPQILFNYTRIRPNTENYLTISGAYEKSNSKDQEDYNKDNTTTLSIYYLNKFYFYKDFGLKINLSGRYSNNETNSNVNNNDSYSISDGFITTAEEGKQNTGSYNAVTEISPGLMYGRTYSGKYSAKAMEIVEELKKSGLLQRELTKSEFLVLSEIIKNRLAIYHYDNRIKKLEALNDITSYLKSIETIEEDSHNAAFVIEDIYSYSLYSSEEDNRRFGFRIYTNLITEFSNTELDNIKNATTIKTKYPYNDVSELLSKYYEKTNNTTDYNAFLKGLKLGLVYNKIVNWNLFYIIGLNYQFDIKDRTRSTSQSIYRDELFPKVNSWDVDDKSVYNYNYKTHQAGFYSTLYYKFNSRSIFSILASIEYNNSNNKITVKDHDDYKSKQNYEYLYYGIRPQLKYYISPKFNVTSGINFSLTRNFNKSSHYVSQIKDYNSHRDHNHHNSTSAFLRFGYYF